MDKKGRHNSSRHLLYSWKLLYIVFTSHPSLVCLWVYFQRAPNFLTGHWFSWEFWNAENDKSLSLSFLRTLALAKRLRSLSFLGDPLGLSYHLSWCPSHAITEKLSPSGYKTTIFLFLSDCIYRLRFHFMHLMKWNSAHEMCLQ